MSVGGPLSERLPGTWRSVSRVDAVLSRAMTVDGDALSIRLETTAYDGTPVTRTVSGPMLCATLRC